MEEENLPGTSQGRPFLGVGMWAMRDKWKVRGRGGTIQCTSCIFMPLVEVWVITTECAVFQWSSSLLHQNMTHHDISRPKFRNVTWSGRSHGCCFGCAAVQWWFGVVFPFVWGMHAPIIAIIRRVAETHIIGNSQQTHMIVYPAVNFRCSELLRFQNNYP
jgi:hypothetical protein